jgi:hypothetical protein
LARGTVEEHKRDRRRLLRRTRRSVITYPYLVFTKARIEGLRGKILSGPVLCVVDFGHGIDYLEARWRSPVTVPMP